MNGLSLLKYSSTEKSPAHSYEKHFTSPYTFPTSHLEIMVTQSNHHKSYGKALHGKKKPTKQKIPHQGN